MTRRQSAFTLIELMVVVAIMAILSSMGVANFSSAIVKARNAARQNDILTVQKSLEVCYNLSNAVYWSEDAGGSGGKTGGSKAFAEANIVERGSTGSGVSGPFKAQAGSTSGNECIDRDILPATANQPYLYAITDGTGMTGQQGFILCALLENGAGVGGLANLFFSAPLTNGSSLYHSGSTNALIEFDTSNTPNPDTNCTTESNDACYFCMKNAQ